MSERITQLRRRMIEDMTVRNLSLATQASYIRLLAIEVTLSVRSFQVPATPGTAA